MDYSSPSGDKNNKKVRCVALTIPACVLSEKVSIRDMVSILCNILLQGVHDKDYKNEIAKIASVSSCSVSDIELVCNLNLINNVFNYGNFFNTSNILPTDSISGVLSKLSYTPCTKKAESFIVNEEYTTNLDYDIEIIVNVISKDSKLEVYEDYESIQLEMLHNTFNYMISKIGIGCAISSRTYATLRKLTKGNKNV